MKKSLERQRYIIKITILTKLRNGDVETEYIANRITDNYNMKPHNGGAETECRVVTKQNYR